MKTREEALAFGLTFENTYKEAPFHDANWQLIRVKPRKKAFLWTYEKNGHVCLNLKCDPDTPTKRIYEAVKRIPKGKVATYAQVAKMAGNPKMCRAVGNALHKNPDFENIPCFRVVNSKGELAREYAFGGAWAQKELLEADGIEVINGKVDLSKYAVEI